MKSQGANRNFAARANPAHWRRPIEQFADLRVCLAHFGSFGNGPYEPSDLGDTWEWTIGRLVASGQATNLFTDLSYFSHILGQEDTAALAKAKRSLAKWIEVFDPNCRRLVYGSDWSCTAEPERKLPEEHGRHADLDRARPGAVRQHPVRQCGPSPWALASHGKPATLLDRFG